MKRKSLSKKLVFLVVMATTMSNFTAYAREMHKDETVYEFKCSDSSIDIKQKNGIIYVKGLTSETDCWFEVTTYIPKEKEEWWQDEPEPDKTIMTYNILGS